MPNQLSAMEESMYQSLKDWLEQYTKHDSKIFLQLHHPGRQNK